MMQLVLSLRSPCGNAMGLDGSYTLTDFTVTEEPWARSSEPFITSNQQASLLPHGNEELCNSHAVVSLWSTSLSLRVVRNDRRSKHG